jgi:hypothetical protein
VNPVLNAHVYEPNVFLQADTLAAQLCVFRVHSLLSKQITPLPVNPALHAHVKEPGISVHVETSMGQLCVPSVHSFSLLQINP